MQAKGAFKRHKPDIVLYLDRMDNVRRSFGDLPLLRSITDMFGASMWFNTIVVLTHASTAPPEGPNGPIRCRPGIWKSGFCCCRESAVQ